VMEALPPSPRRTPPSALSCILSVHMASLEESDRMGDRICPAHLVTWLEYLCALLSFDLGVSVLRQASSTCSVLMFGPCQLMVLVV
jgi:hypothetical protein